MSANDPKQTLTPTRNGVISQHVRFQFEFIKSVFENIANADNSHELIALPDGYVADPSLGHKLHHMSNAVVG